MHTDHDAAGQSRLIAIDCGHASMEGMLESPARPFGIVLFAHGSGSSRLSPRNNFVARLLRQAGMATLLLDLLTPEEDEIYRTRFDIALLTERLQAAAAWIRQQQSIGGLPLGLFGASTGAAAALQLCAMPEQTIAACVSRGGRPDLAGTQSLENVRAPTLLIVGGLDETVLELNRDAYERMHCEKRLEVIPGATHLFEEPGKLESAAQLARDWFVEHMAVDGNARSWP